MALSAAAGPISNILLALVLLIVYRILGWFSGMAIASVGLYQIIMQILLLIIQISISLGIFNLLPVPPLDGSRLFLSFLPSSTYFKIMQYERYIMIALFLLLFTGALSIPLSWLSGWVLDLLELITRPISMLGQLIF